MKVQMLNNTAEYILAMSKRKPLMALGADISEEQRIEFEDLNNSIKFYEAAVTLAAAGVMRR